ncbi:MAG: metal-dependent transcriptional regulator [Candidatus Krumholzibacteriota bacterium]|nr:metal-dependent transcriptional regulator [Candidatus Krumholzibacteriota bacterium]
MVDKKCYHDPVDEALETLWTLEERGEKALEDRILSGNSRGILDKALLSRMIEENLLREENGIYSFTDQGRERGKGIIRRHRLAERLLTDVLNIKEDIRVESDACCFEHFLSPEVTDHICILLGHPRYCPHGNKIPPGKCCERAARQVETAVVSLRDLKPGESGRILYISTKQHSRLDRLTAMGLFPGSSIKVHQCEPLFVVFLDEIQIALDKGIVEEIYVLKS